VLGVGAATSAIAAVIMGKYALRFGYWRSLIFCLICCAIMTIPQAFVTNMYQLVVLRAISSFFIGGTAPVVNAIIATTADRKHQGTTYGFTSSISSAGAALGPMIGSAAAMLSYRAVFIVSAVLLMMSSWTIVRRRMHQSES
ncbi:MAG: MFS transporter, partial [Treponema sp.]|nr:MFS transporter [Treponema sp.]